MFRKLAAECFGTFWLVFGGCGSAVLAAGFPELGVRSDRSDNGLCCWSYFWWSF